MPEDRIEPPINTGDDEPRFITLDDPWLNRLVDRVMLGYRDEDDPDDE